MEAKLGGNFPLDSVQLQRVEKQEGKDKNTGESVYEAEHFNEGENEKEEVVKEIKKFPRTKEFFSSHFATVHGVSFHIHTHHVTFYNPRGEGMGSEQPKSFGRERKRDTKKKVKYQASAIRMRLCCSAAVLDAHNHEDMYCTWKVG